MRHQLRLLDQNLPGFARELARRAWTVMEGLLDGPADARLGRALFRAVRRVLKRRMQAFRYCGATHGCEGSFGRGVHPVRFAHEAWPGERVKVYLAGPETTPEALERELTAALLQAAVEALPGRRLPGLARMLRRAVAGALNPRMFAAAECGDLPLCGLNEPYDPWDRRDLANALRPLAGRV